MGIGMDRHMAVWRSTGVTRADNDVGISGNNAIFIDQQRVDIQLNDLGQLTANL